MSNSEVIRLLDKIGANDRHRNSVANSLSLVDPNTEKVILIENLLILFAFLVWNCRKVSFRYS
jgi:hypothetical protein